MSEDDKYTFDDMPTVPQIFHQLGILVLDGSGSMSGIIDGKITKAEAVNISVRELLTRFIASKNSKDFSISIVTFDSRVIIHTTPTRIKDENDQTIDDNADYDPMKGHGGSTDLAQALQEAFTVAKDFLTNAPPDSVPHSAVIVVMSDGMSHTDPVPIAENIKQEQNITICSTLFAQKGNVDQRAQKILQDIASSPSNYKTVYDAETLRKFFVASVSSGKNVNII